jgi:hypothetical protein
MALRDPVVVYTAADNAEADHVSNLLNLAGIEAYFMADDGTITAWYVSLLSQTHKPKVWVEREDLARAQPVLLEYERKMQERRDAEAGLSDSDASPIEVTCDGCGQQTTFPAELRGTVQNCSHCDGYLDVGEEGIFRAEDREGVFRPEDEEGDTE